jgi:serine/threonine-protein kinase
VIYSFERLTKAPITINFLKKEERMGKRWLTGVIYALLITGFLLSPGCRLGQVTVPDLTNNTLEGAKAISERLGLMPEVSEEVESEMAPGLICAQNPLAGSVVRRGSKVAVSVSKGPQGKVVPELTGLCLSEVSARLYEAGLRIGEIEYRSSEEVAKDLVIESNPSVGTRLAPGSPVNLVLSSGSEPRTAVPNLVGRSLSRARSLLASQGLEVGEITYRVSTEYYAGTVIGQEPMPKTQVRKGSAVSLVVAKTLR